MTGATYSRPLVDADFSVIIQNVDTGKPQFVEFWITQLHSEQYVEMLYSFNNSCHKKDRASYAVYNNGELLFRHRDTAILLSWDSDSKSVIEKIRKEINTQIEEALGLRDDS